MNSRRLDNPDHEPRKARTPGASTPERPAFTVLERTILKGVGVLVSVELDQDTDDFAHLVGKKIVINGRLETCFSVERFNHSPPWRAGDRIGLRFIGLVGMPAGQDRSRPGTSLALVSRTLPRPGEFSESWKRAARRQRSTLRRRAVFLVVWSNGARS